MNPEPSRILVVEDERQQLALICINLELAGYRVFVATDGFQALEMVNKGKPDLILLDIRLPGMDGLSVCRQIRRSLTTPIIMVTSKSMEEDVIEGLNAGADDYLTKPFGVGELMARVNAHLRRGEMSSPSYTREVIELGELRIDRHLKRVYVAGEEVKLTNIEYRLLVELASQHDIVLGSEYLLRQVWGPGYEDAEGVLRQAVRRLRQKIEHDEGRFSRLQTRTGIGYVLVSKPDVSSKD